MNKRQKKKLFKQTLVKVKKLHPQKGDVIAVQPNLDWVDIDTAVEIVNFSKNKNVFGEATVVILPMDIKKINNKEDILEYIDTLQSIVDEMGE